MCRYQYAVWIICRGGRAPVRGRGQRRVAGDRADLLLPDVVRPPAAVDALAAGQRGQRQERAVDRVGVEPVVRPGAHDDHRPAAGLLGVRGELPGDAGRGRRGDTGDRVLPGRGARAVPGRRTPAGQSPGSPSRPTPYWASSRSKTVVTRCPPIRRTGTPRRIAPAAPSAVVEPRQLDRDRGLAATGGREQRVDVAEVEVPPAGAGLGVPEAERAVRHERFAGGCVEQDGLERRRSRPGDACPAGRRR